MHTVSIHIYLSFLLRKVGFTVNIIHIDCYFCHLYLRHARGFTWEKLTQQNNLCSSWESLPQQRKKKCMCQRNQIGSCMTRRKLQFSGSLVFISCIILYFSCTVTLGNSSSGFCSSDQKFKSSHPEIARDPEQDSCPSTAQLYA